MNASLCMYFNHAVSSSEWLSHHKRQRVTYVKVILTTQSTKEENEISIIKKTLFNADDIRRKKIIHVGQTIRFNVGRSYDIPFDLISMKGCRICIELWGKLHTMKNIDEVVLQKESKNIILGRTKNMKTEDMNFITRNSVPSSNELNGGDGDDKRGRKRENKVNKSAKNGETKKEGTASVPLPVLLVPSSPSSSKLKTISKKNELTELQRLLPLHRRDPTVQIGTLLCSLWMEPIKEMGGNNFDDPNALKESLLRTSDCTLYVIEVVSR